MWTALVRTGRFPPGHPWDCGLPRPDFDAADLPDLMARLDLAFPGWLAPDAGRAGPGARAAAGQR
jgi:4-nitrophenyl phosphatase/NagD protein